MKHITWLAILALLVMTACGRDGSTTARQPEAEPSILGSWIAVGFGGDGAVGVAGIKKLEYVFKDGGAFSATMARSRNRVRTIDGTYKLLPTTIEMSAPGEKTERATYTLSKDQLTLKDPKRDRWVRFKRKGQAEQGPPAKTDKRPR